MQICLHFSHAHICCRISSSTIFTYLIHVVRVLLVNTEQHCRLRFTVEYRTFEHNMLSIYARCDLHHASNFIILNNKQCLLNILNNLNKIYTNYIENLLTLGRSLYDTYFEDTHLGKRSCSVFIY